MKMMFSFSQNKINQPQLIIPKEKVIETFQNIPYESYDSLLFGVSQNKLKLNSEKEIINFFNTMGYGIKGKKLFLGKNFEKLNK